MRPGVRRLIHAGRDAPFTRSDIGLAHVTNGDQSTGHLTPRSSSAGYGSRPLVVYVVPSGLVHW